jgi:hypothetical protein
MPNEILNTRSNEVNEILGKPPKAIIRWGISIVFVVVIIILIGSYYIPYPTILETKAKVSSIKYGTDSNSIIGFKIDKNIQNIKNIKQEQTVSFQLIGKQGEELFFKGSINKIYINSDYIFLNVEISNIPENIEKDYNESVIIPVLIVIEDQPLLSKIIKKIIKNLNIYHMVSQQMKHLIKDAGIMQNAMHSDHCPCFVELL